MATTEQRLATLEKKVTNITNARAQSGLGVVHHADAKAPRPLTKYAALVWVGAAEPINAVSGDLWAKTE